MAEGEGLEPPTVLPATLFKSAWLTVAGPSWLDKVQAEGTGFEPAHPRRDYGLANRCLTIRHTLPYLSTGGERGSRTPKGFCPASFRDRRRRQSACLSVVLLVGIEPTLSGRKAGVLTTRRQEHKAAFLVQLGVNGSRAKIRILPNCLSISGQAITMGLLTPRNTSLLHAIVGHIVLICKYT